MPDREQHGEGEQGGGRAGGRGGLFDNDADDNCDNNAHIPFSLSFVPCRWLGAVCWFGSLFAGALLGVQRMYHVRRARYGAQQSTSPILQTMLRLSIISEGGLKHWADTILPAEQRGPAGHWGLLGLDWTGLGSWT